MNKILTLALLPSMLFVSTMHTEARSHKERNKQRKEQRGKRQKKKGKSLVTTALTVSPIVAELEVKNGFHVDQVALLDYIHQGKSDEVRDVVMREWMMRTSIGSRGPTNRGSWLSLSVDWRSMLSKSAWLRRSSGFSARKACTTERKAWLT